MRKNLKSNKAIAIMDIVIALTVLALLVGSVGTLYYEIAYNDLRIKYGAIATYYVVNILESIDEQNYDDVRSMSNEEFKRKFENDEYSSFLELSTKVENYNQDDEEKKDLIKIVTIEVKYRVLQDDMSYTVKKLKIREKEN